MNVAKQTINQDLFNHIFRMNLSLYESMQFFMYFIQIDLECITDSKYFEMIERHSV